MRQFPKSFYKTDTVVEKVVVNIIDTLMPRQTLICKKEIAATNTEVNQKLNFLFQQEFPKILDSLKLEPSGAPFLWNVSAKAPFVIEAGIPVKDPQIKSWNAYYFKKVGGDSAIVAQFYGPYSGISVAYQGLDNWFKNFKRKRKSPPYEIYVDKPYDEKGKLKNPYKVQTNVVYPLLHK